MNPKFYILKYGCIKQIKYENYKQGNKGLILDGSMIETFTADKYIDGCLIGYDLKVLDGESLSGEWFILNKRKEVKR